MNKRQAKKRQRRIGKAIYKGDIKYKKLVEMLFPNCEAKCEIYLHVNKGSEEK